MSKTFKQEFKTKSPKNPEISYKKDSRKIKDKLKVFCR